MTNFSLLFFLVLMLGMSFLMQSRQKKQMQQRQDELKGLTKGTQVVTIGGLYATVDEVDPEQNTVVLDADGIYLTFELSAIKRIIQATGTPAPVDDAQETETGHFNQAVLEADKLAD